MKKLVVVIATLFLQQMTILSQGCLPEGITFTTQEQIDNFQVNYPGCTEIEGDVIITGGEINNLNGLNILSEIGGSLSIVYNSVLTDLSGLGMVTSIGSDLSIAFLSTLLNLTGFDNLASVGGSLFIGNNASLINLNGIGNLSFIGGGLTIQDNDALTGLSEFEEVSSLGGDLGVSYNDALTGLCGLDNIDAGSVINIQIIFNTQLSYCHVKSICDYLGSPNGTILIQLNSPGCNSPEEVEAACEAISVEEIYTERGITIIPNPSNDKITICFPSLTGHSKLTIFTVGGAKVLERMLTANEIQINISALPRGVYFVKLQNENLSEVAKMIKE